MCCGAALFLAALTFTPLVIPPGRIHPTLGGMPLTLWAGLGIAFAFVALTWIGTQVHPDREEAHAGRDMHPGEDR